MERFKARPAQVDNGEWRPSRLGVVARDIVTFTALSAAITTVAAVETLMGWNKTTDPSKSPLGRAAPPAQEHHYMHMRLTSGKHHGTVSGKEASAAAKNAARDKRLGRDS